jgi:threonine synthase
LIKCARKGLLKEGETVVCTLTGHGLKDPDTATRIQALPTPVAAEIETVLKAIGF